MNTDERTNLSDNLLSVLERQIKAARRGNFSLVEALAEKADSIVEKIIKTKTLEQPQFNGRREQLMKTYKKLELILAAGKDSVGKQLRQIDNGRKILHVYRNNS